MQQINNGFCEYYYLTKDGKIFNEQTKEYKTVNKENKFTLKKEDGTSKRIALKTLYKMVYGITYCNDNILNLDGEEWKEIDNTNGVYYVSNFGRVKSYSGYNAKILKANKTRNGYYRLDIVQDGERVSKLVHRLVASSFLPTPSSIDMELHHIDCNKGNNSSKNLEWLTITDHRKKHRERNKENVELQQ